jgi:hypothetical protein
MTDHEGKPQLEEEEAGDRGLPLFWGILVMAAVAAIAVWLFGQVDFAGSSTDTTVGAVETTVTQPAASVDVVRNDGLDRSTGHTMEARIDAFLSNVGSASDGDGAILVMSEKAEAGGQKPT